MVQRLLPKAGGGFTPENQLENLSDEELEALKQGLIAKQQGFGKQATGALLAAGEGALLASQGRPLSQARSLQPEKKGGTGLEDLLQREQLKNAIDPTRQKSQLELEEIQRKRKGLGGIAGVQDTGSAIEPGTAAGIEPSADIQQERTETPAQFIQISDGVDKFGNEKFKTVKNPDFESFQKEQDLIRKGRIEAVGKSITAQRMSLQQIDLISNSAKLLAETHVAAIKEGGLGSLANEFRGKASLFFGGEQAEQFEETEAFPGLKTEIISRLMPTLTQQGDKPGSVRLVQTIFAKLEMTLPGGKTPAKNARNMMRKTLTNAFNFARAADRLGLTNEFIESVPDEELASFSDKVEKLAKAITLSEAKQDALDLLLAKSLSPYDEFILERGDREGSLKKRFGLE